MFSFGIKNKNVKTGVTAPISETKASLTIQSALKVEAKPLGVLGNSITIRAVANSTDTLAVSVTGNAITILLANATGTKNTMTLIAALMDSTPAVSALVNEVVIAGATQMTAFTVQSLSGGINGTVGYLGEVRFDTNGNRWGMIWTNGSVYYWSPDGFPAVNTEYASHVEAGTVIYKYRYSVDNVGTTTPLTVNHGIANIGVFKPIGSDCYIGSAYNSIRKGFYTATNHYIQFTVTTTQIITAFASPTFNSTGVSTEFYYTKTA